MHKPIESKCGEHSGSPERLVELGAGTALGTKDMHKVFGLNIFFYLHFPLLLYLAFSFSETTSKIFWGTVGYQTPGLRIMPS